MNKPSWNRAPEWAQYLAQDQDGTWWWFEDEPEKKQWTTGGFWSNKFNTLCEQASGWQTTLEGRP